MASLFVSDGWDEALYDAVMLNNLADLERVIQCGADKDEVFDGFTPLIWASGNRNSRHIVDYLLALGANVNFSANGGYTALHNACQYKQWEVAEVLIVHGADTTIRHNGKLALDLVNDEAEKERLQSIRNRMEKAEAAATQISSILISSESGALSSGCIGIPTQVNSKIVSNTA